MPAANIEAEIDDWFLGAGVEARLGIGQILALHHDALLHRQQFAGLLDVFQGFDVGGIGARFGDKAEFELGRRSKNFLELAGILQTRHFDENTIGALPLDVGLRGAERIDAAAQHFDRLLDGAADLAFDALPGHRELDEAAFVFAHLEVRRARTAGKAAAGGGRQLLEFRHDPRPLARIGDAQLHAAWLSTNAPRDRDFLFAKHTPDAVAQIVDKTLHDRIAVHLEKHMRSSLQIEAEHDGAGRQPFRQMRNQRLATVRAEKTRHDEEKRERRHRQNGYDLPGRKTQHDGAKSRRLWEFPCCRLRFKPDP